MSNWILALIAFLYFAASMSAFYDGRAVMGCILLSWSAGNLGMLLLGVGAR